MSEYEFSIGATEAEMVTLQAIGLPAPYYEYAAATGSITLGDGSEQAVGAPATSWHWGFLTANQRSALKSYCPGRSAEVFIRTKIDDETYADFQAILVWPNSENRQASRVVDFTIDFRNMVVI